MCGGLSVPQVRCKKARGQVRSCEVGKIAIHHGSSVWGQSINYELTNALLIVVLMMNGTRALLPVINDHF